MGSKVNVVYSGAALLSMVQLLLVISTYLNTLYPTQLLAYVLPHYSILPAS